MKTIGLLSDTHSFLTPAISTHFSDCDEIWHAGDIGNTETADLLEKIKPLRAVYGNIDSIEIRRRYPLNQVFECEGVKVIITHIAGYPGKYSARALQLIATHIPKLFICGHSHIIKVIYDKKLDHLHINPGAAGREGFHKICTFVKFIIDDHHIRDLRIIEQNR